MKHDFKILQGDALGVLKNMPSESVQCCITSPPYYGLRSYGTDPQVWDGDAECQHVWGIEKLKTTQPSRDVSGGLSGRDKGTRGEQGYAAAMGVTASLGSFCQVCNAWRGELGLEPTFHLYLDHLIQIFAEVKRVLKSDGVCWVNLGDSYATHAGGVVKDPMRASGLAGTKHQEVARKTSALGQYKKGGSLPEKCLMNIPARFAIRMTDELQMIQRNMIIWHKPSCMPSSAKDRFTVDFEPIFFFSKNPKYKFNQQIEQAVYPAGTKAAKGLEIRYSEDGVNARPPEYKVYDGRRNKRTTWKVNFEPQSDAHYASYPTKLVEPMILAGTDEGDVVLDPFAGTGTTLLTALRHRRQAVGIELQPKYVAILERRLSEVQVNLF